MASRCDVAQHLPRGQLNGNLRSAPYILDVGAHSSLGAVRPSRGLLPLARDGAEDGLRCPKPFERALQDDAGRPRAPAGLRPGGGSELPPEGARGAEGPGRVVVVTASEPRVALVKSRHAGGLQKAAEPQGALESGLGFRNKKDGGFQGFRGIFVHSGGRFMEF